MAPCFDLSLFESKLKSLKQKMRVGANRVEGSDEVEGQEEEDNA